MYKYAALQITGISATKNSMRVSSLLSIICLYRYTMPFKPLSPPLAD